MQYIYVLVKLALVSLTRKLISNLDVGIKKKLVAQSWTNGVYSSLLHFSVS